MENSVTTPGSTISSCWRLRLSDRREALDERSHGICHSGAPRSGEPGIHNHKPGVMDSGFSALRASPRNDGVYVDSNFGNAALVLNRLRDALRGLGREGLPPGSAMAYLFALGCVGVAALAHMAFARSGTDIAPSILYNPAVFVAALVGGLRA